MADGLRSQGSPEYKEEQVLGDKATGGVDNDQDHLLNVERGLKAYVMPAIKDVPLLTCHYRAISNPNTSTKAKKQAEEKLETLKDQTAALNTAAV